MFFLATASFAAAAPSRKVSDRDEAGAAVARVPAKAAGPRSAVGVAVGHLCGALGGPIGFGSKLCRSALAASRAACVRIRPRLAWGRTRGKF